MNKSYPVLELDLKKLRHNIKEIVRICGEHEIRVSGVVKVFNGIPEAMMQYNDCGCFGICSSRLEHLKRAAEAGVQGPYISIRIPMLSEVDDLVRYSDISLESEWEVLKAVEEACCRQDKTHGAILMADLGDLREGFWDKDEMVAVAERVENELSHVTLSGVGVNLGCYGSIKPTVEKMNELVSIAERIEEKIGRRLDIISGGATSTLPMVIDHTIPERINQLRVGEGLVVANDLQEIWEIPMDYMNRDVFTLKAEVIELKDKPSHPVGEIFVDAFGNRQEYTDRGIRRRAIAGVGKVDFAFDDQLMPRMKGVEILGSSSDHLLLDVEDVKDQIKLGDVLEFDICYGPMVFLSNDEYVPVICK